MVISPIRFELSKVLLVMNSHREIPSAAWAGRCEVTSNEDFLILKPSRK